MDNLDNGEEINTEWSYESDTVEKIPDYNLLRKIPFQKPRKFPADLPKDHLEGVFYTRWFCRKTTIRRSLL